MPDKQVVAQAWTDADIGTVTKVGSSSYDGNTGTYTVKGSGADIWGTADAFHFVYQTITGDGELTARVVSVQNTSGWAKAGVMVRQSVDPGSTEALTAQSFSNGVTFQYRTVVAANSSNLAAANTGAPGWVKIVKDGNLVTSYQSPDGINWMYMGFTQVTFTGPVQIGLAVTSHNNNQLCTATFDNITLITTTTFAAPRPWLDQDIGSVGLTGAVHFENNLFTVYGGGADIWGNADAFHYVYQPLNGDGSILTQVAAQTNSSGWSKAGVMIRQDLTAGSPQAALYVTPGSGIAFQRRYTAGGSSVTTAGAAVKAPYWLKLVRTGNQFYSYQSPEGTTWTLLGVDTIAMTPQVNIGMAECAHNNSTLGLAFFDDVQVGPAVLTANSVSDTTVNLIWPSLADPNVVASYEIDRNGTSIATSPTTYFEDVQLTASTPYSYVVKAWDASHHLLAATPALSVTTLAPFLPSPWSHLDIGAILLGGYTQEDDTTQTFTLVGSGTDIWGTADAFQFAQEPLTGDGQILARVKSVSPTSGWTKAGVMLRETNAAGSKQASLFLTLGNGLAFQRRTTTNGSSTTTSGGAAPGPIWVKLLRQGSRISSYSSTDGINWTLVAQDTVAMNAALEAGLALTSHNPDALATAVIDNVSVQAGLPADTQPPTVPGTPTLVAQGDVSATIQWTAASDPVGVTGYQILRNGQVIDTTSCVYYTDKGLAPGGSYNYSIKAINFGGLLSTASNALSVTTPGRGVPTPWTHQEVGTVGMAGTASGDGSSFTIAASGNDIWNTADAFGYVSQALTGDGQLTARVTGIGSSNPWAKAGVMLRQSLDPGSPHALMLLSAGHGLAFQMRTTQGMNCVNDGGAATTAPAWVRVVRQGTVITGYSSSDGVTWSQGGHTTISFGSTIYAGLAVTSHLNGTLTQATFDNVSVTTTSGTNSGIPDAWEIQYFGHTGLDPNAFSPAGDGDTLLEEYQLGRNPLDYYQGLPPLLSVVSGNNQTAYSNAFLTNPLVVQVTNANNQPLVNAPITFTVSAGGGQLATTNGGAPALSSTLSMVTDAHGNAQAYFQIGTSGTQQVTVTAGAAVVLFQSHASIAGTGLRGTYFSGIDFGQYVLTRLDPQVAFDWGNGSPDPSIPSDLFSVIWRGQIQADYTETYTFTTGSDDGMRLWVNGQLLVDDWNPHGYQEQSGSIALTAGQKYDIRVEYFENTGAAQVDLYWESPSLSRQVVPADHLYLPAGDLTDSDNDGLIDAWEIAHFGDLSKTGQDDVTGNGFNTVFAQERNISPTDFYNGQAPLQVSNYLTAGPDNSAALLDNGNTFAWGFGGDGRLGVGIEIETSSPIWNPYLSNLKEIAMGDGHGLAVDDAGQVIAWGVDSDGQLGDGTNMDRTHPAAVSGISGVRHVAAGDNHSVALKLDGTVWAWGDNSSGQLGNGSFDPSSNLPVQVPGISNAIAIAAHSDHTLALLSDGTVVGWGDNINGQLGSGTTNSSSTPLPVVNLTGVTAIATGLFHGLALRSDHTVWAWGQNGEGEYGNGQTSGGLVPVPAALGLTKVIAIAAGGYHSLALRADGTVWAWGWNSNGQVGNNSNGNQILPVRVLNLTNVIAIAAGHAHSLAVKADGTIWAWGWNQHGQLGDGTTTDRWTPVQVGRIRVLPGIVDINHNGMADVLELALFGDLTHSGTADDDGDGVSNAQELLNGTDPTDYYNGTQPQVTVVGGDQQTGPPNAFLSNLLIVQVTDANSQPLVNVPVTFTVSQGGGQLATTNGGAPALSSAQTAMSDANGNASFYYEQPSTIGVTSQITVTAGTGQSVVFTETTGNGLLLWLQASQGVTVDGNGLVSNWADQSGNGNDASQGDSSSRPLLVSNAINGQPVIRFFGTNNFLQFAKQTRIQTAIFVVKHATGSQDYAPILGDTGSSDFAGGQGSALFLNGTTNTAITGGQAYVDGTAISPFALQKPTEYEIIAMVMSGPVSASTISKDQSFTDRCWQGDFAEIRLYDHALSTAELQTAYQALEQTYQILPGAWQLQYFGKLGIDPDADPDGDGLTNFQEYQQGTDPTDFFNGVKPVLTMISGDNQFADWGSFLPTPTVILVTKPDGTAWVNAPVQISTTDADDTGLSATPQSQSGASTLTIRSDGKGLVIVYRKLPN